MLEIKHKGLTLKVYDSIEELPVDRYFKHNAYLLLDAGLGSGLEGYAKRAGLIAKFIDEGETKKAKAELDNLTQSLVFTLNEIHPESLSFVPFIFSINGKEVNDLSDEGAKATIRRLSKGGFSYRVLKSALDLVKKKIDRELKVFFPDIAISPKNKEHYRRLKRLAITKLEAIIKDEDKSQDIAGLNSEILAAITPKQYAGSKGLEVVFKKSFETSCFVTLNHVPKDPKKMSVLEFFNTLEVIEEKARKSKKQNMKYA